MKEKMVPQKALTIESLTVKKDRITCMVKLAPGVSPYASPDLIARVCTAFPQIPLHACKNEKGTTFEAVMSHTSLPHVLEHLVIDLQVQKSGATERLFVGTSEWEDEEKGIAKIEVSFADDLNALRAFHDAVQFLNEAML